VTGIERLAEHGSALFVDGVPDAVMCDTPRIAYRREGDSVLATIPLPGADRDHLDVVKIDDELTITTGLRRRSLVLPRRVAALAVQSAKLREGVLRVRFAKAGDSDAEFGGSQLSDAVGRPGRIAGRFDAGGPPPSEDDPRKRH
jgi:HSP20 family molecular chaperone IbpA